MAQNPKSRSRGSVPGAPAPRRSPTLELPFNDDDVQPLRADDPRPQRVPQYPTNARRPARKAEEAIPTSIYDVSQDEEFQPSYDAQELSDSGFKPAFIYVERGPGQGQLVPVRQGTMVIGRASISELRLQHASISRRHAQITRLGERFYIKDLGSQNGTFVNRTRIGTEVEIQPGDEISVGNALLRMRGPVQPAEAPVQHKSQRRSKPVASARKKLSAARIGMLGGAIGFGIAGVFTFAVLRVMRGPSYRELPTATRSVHPGPSASPVSEHESDAVSARIQRAMQEAAAKEQATARPSAEPAVEVSDAHVVRISAPGSAAAGVSQKKLTATKVASRTHTAGDEEAASPPPARGSGAHNPSILERYGEGDVEAALELASQENDKDLMGKLTRFQSAYDAAKASLEAKDGTGAIRNFSAALKADEPLSKGGWGKYGAEIRKQLGGLYTLVGFKHMENEDSEDAQKAFSAALKYDPDNAKARQQLAKLTGGESGAASGKKKADDAFTDQQTEAAAPAAAPAKPATRRPAGSKALPVPSDDEASAPPAKSPSRKPAASSKAAADAAFGD
jgi:pSer/pThr/pTyr-binding forkhead associated (FHA) protein